MLLHISIFWILKGLIVHWKIWHNVKWRKISLSIRNETFWFESPVFYVFCFDLMRFGFLCLICYIPQILSYQGLQGIKHPRPIHKSYRLVRIGRGHSKLLSAGLISVEINLLNKDQKELPTKWESPVQSRYIWLFLQHVFLLFAFRCPISIKWDKPRKMA